MAQNGRLSQALLPEALADATPRPYQVVADSESGEAAGLRMSRWLSADPAPQWTLALAHDEYVISLCQRTTRAEFRSGAGTVFHGVMRAGVFHVTGPAKAIAARFTGPCDLLHLHVSRRLLLTRLQGMGADPTGLEGLDRRTLSDPLLEQLFKLLASGAARADQTYATAIAQTLLTRLLHLARDVAPVGALAKWRLRRVEALVEARLAEPLTLSDMAAAGGLSRMHFAAQFRVATGSSPHDYLLSRRIETAKALLAETDTSLAEIALSVGFLAQAHFTTVFKRLTNETPARWRRACRDAREVPRHREADREPGAGARSSARSGA